MEVLYSEPEDFKEEKEMVLSYNNGEIEIKAKNELQLSLMLATLIYYASKQLKFKKEDKSDELDNYIGILKGMVKVIADLDEEEEE